MNSADKTLKVPLIYAVIVAVLSACSSVQTPTDSGSTVAPNSPATSKVVSTNAIKIDGSSTVYPITDAVAKQFRQSNPTVEISVEFSGTTGGLRKFCAGQTDVSNASRPISTEEIAACRANGVRFIELPIAFDALTIAIHPQNTWASSLTVEELRKIWEPVAQGKIRNWKQVRPDFPDRPLVLYGAGTDSGTYDYFTQVITNGSETRSDYTASEDDTVLVQDVANDPNALGYFGFSYYEQNRDKLKAVAIDDGKGAIAPSSEAVENAQYQPLSRPLFIYVNGLASQQNSQLRDFVIFYMQNAPQVVPQVGYIPMPQEAYEIAQTHLFKGEYGTAYEGKPQPYLTIREVLQKEQKL